MADLTEFEVQALAKASNVSIPKELLPEVTFNLNALMEALDNIEVPGIDRVEPLSIIIPFTPPSTR